MIKLITCPNCKQLTPEHKSKKVLIDGKEKRICKDCFNLLNGIIGKNTLINGLNNGNIKINQKGQKWNFIYGTFYQ